MRRILLDWILAELIRLSGIEANEGYKLIKAITVNGIPSIEDFGGFLKTLNPDLKVSEIVLLLLYHQGTTGASFSELSTWVKPKQRPNLKSTLQRLEHEKDLLVLRGERILLLDAV